MSLKSLVEGLKRSIQYFIRFKPFVGVYIHLHFNNSPLMHIMGVSFQHESSKSNYDDDYSTSKGWSDSNV